MTKGELSIERIKRVMAAMEPFARAASVGSLAEGQVRKTDMSEITTLLGVPGYVGISVAQDRVSWADWKALLEAWNYGA